ncbi:MAG TPA: hypothetical protein VI032_12540 [Burkholderiaceae bacterium]
MTLSRTLLLLCALPLTTAASANDFPTAERVLYVNECMRANPGPQFEMVNKCSCALDRLASEVKYDDYVSMSTIVNAITIGGERGSEMRDNESLKPQIARFRELQARVNKACFIEKR